MSAKVIFQEKIPDESIKKAVLKIPRKAVVNKNGKNIVFAIEGSKAIEKEVQLGAIQGGYVVVKKGLNEGEKIVVEGHSHLDDNNSISFE